MNELRTQFAETTVLVVGDLMLDEYLYGNVNRISPEAPVPVLDVKRRRYVPGGAGNVAANIRSLGAAVQLVAICGDDGAAEHLRASLREAEVGVEHVMRVAGRLTTAKTRVVAGPQQIVRVDTEERVALEADHCKRFENILVGAIDGTHAIILSDYGKGLLTPALCNRVLELANQAGVPTIVDPKGRDYSKYKGCTLITPNLKEAGEATGIVIESEQDLDEAGARLLELLPGTAVLITRGPDGMALYREGKDAYAIPTVAQEVFDVVGAGDTAVAALGVALGAGLPMPAAVHLANTAAGIAVGKRGTVAVRIGEVLERVDENVLKESAGSSY